MIKNLEADVSEFIDKVFDNEDEAMAAYKEYSMRIGFGVRRGKKEKRKDGSYNGCNFICNRQGFKIKSAKEVSCTKTDMRIGCPARVHFCVDKLGRYTVTKHDMLHNHDFVRQRERHLVRSNRCISDKELQLILFLKDCGFKTADIIRMLKRSAGGSEFLGFTEVDVYNAISRHREAQFDGNDANTLICILRQRMASEDGFSFTFLLDDVGRLCALFWIDGIMRRAYEIFGDLLVFDTTFRTNRYNMVCALFSGLNNHSNTIMFGCALMIRETIQSFEWLFRVFLDSVGQKQPITIMTDESAAMAAAIKSTLPKSNHRLCVFHIIKNAKLRIRHLFNLNGFPHAFLHLIKGCDSEAEFNFYSKQ